MAWDVYVVNEYGLLDTCSFWQDNFGYTVGPNNYTIIQGDFQGSPIKPSGGEGITYSPGASVARSPLLYFAMYNASGQKTGYIGYDYAITSSHTGGGSPIVSVTITCCERDLNYAIVRDLGDRTVGTSASNYSVYTVQFFLSIGKSTANTTAVAGVLQLFNEEDHEQSGDGYCWVGILSSDTAFQGIRYSTKEKSKEFGDKSQPGGYGYDGVYGSHDYHSDHSGIPTKPQYGFTSAGFLNHYLITSQGLEQLGEALFPSPTGSSTDTTNAIDRLTAIMWNSKIIDYVVDCRIIPVYPHDSGYHNITCGGKVLVHPGTGAVYRAALIDEDFVDVDCGTITTPITEGNFLDFYQMSCKLFLPFYGFVDIAPEYWNGATIGVYYRFNMMDGSFMVWLTSKAYSSDMNADDVIAQYAGNACIHLPVNSLSYSQMISGMITTGAAIVGAATGAGVAGLAGEAGGTAALGGAVASGAANVINSRPQLNANNSYNGSAALMSKRTPYLLIEFNQAQFSGTYVNEKGLPLVDDVLLSSLSGMTVCSNPVINFACADEEADEIRSLLASGVIL